MNSISKQSQDGKQNNSALKTIRAIIKESLIVCIWICFSTLTIWGADGFGFLSTASFVPSNSLLQVDFPKVYNIWKQKKAVFVDVRSVAHFRRGHIPGAVNIPINRIVMHLSDLPIDKDTPLITYCGSITCPNAYQLMHVLLGHGYQNVRFFPRGLRGWLSLGYPLETE